MSTFIDQVVTTSCPTCSHHSRSHHNRRRNVVVLHPGQSATRSCSRFPVRTVHRVIQKGEALIVICKGSNRRLIFIGGFVGRVRVAVIPKRARIRVTRID